MVQLTDVITFKGKRYMIIARTNGFREIESFGLIPDCKTDHCILGYWRELEIINNKLVLRDLFVNSEKYPSINNISPVKTDEKDMIGVGHHLYKGINIDESYTGKIMVGRNTLLDYISIGFPEAFAYGEVLEFEFMNGELIDIKNYSSKMIPIRIQIDSLRYKSKKKKGYSKNTNSDIISTIEKAFSLSYETKCWWLDEEEPIFN